MGRHIPIWLISEGVTPPPNPPPHPPAPKRSQNSIVSFRTHYRTFPCKITSHQAIGTKNRENGRVLWRTEVKRLNWNSLEYSGMYSIKDSFPLEKNRIAVKPQNVAKNTYNDVFIHMISLVTSAYQHWQKDDI